MHKRPKPRLRLLVVFKAAVSTLVLLGGEADGYPNPNFRPSKYDDGEKKDPKRHFAPTVDHLTQQQVKRVREPVSKVHAVDHG